MNQKGIILVYTIIVASIMLAISGALADSIMSESRISRDEYESMKAYYAADSITECVRFLENNHHAFDATSPRGTYNCGVGADFEAGNPILDPLPPPPDCTLLVPYIYNFTVSGFDNGACAIVELKMESRLVAGTNICGFKLLVRGRNTCAPGATNVVDRARWEDF